MQAISQFVVRVFDLIEAEGRSLHTVVRGEARRAQTAVTNMAMAAALLFISVVLSLAGMWLLGAALMWWLETQVSRPLAACFTGLVILASGGACLYGFKQLARKHHP